MNLDEEAEYLRSAKEGGYCIEVQPDDYCKMLAVIKAAKMVCEGMKDENYYILGSELLESSLEELEKE